MMKTQIGQKTKMALLGAAVVLPLSMAATQASATAIAYSALEVENFSTSGMTFTSFLFQSKTITATLNGTLESQIGTSCSASGCGVDLPNVVNGVAPWAVDSDDDGHATVFTVAAPGDLTSNSYIANGPTLADAGNFAVGDSHMTNTRTAIGNGKFGSQSAVGVTGSSSGESNTGADNKMFWNFTASNTTIDFSFDYDLALFGETTQENEFADAGVKFVVQLLLDGAVYNNQELVVLNLAPGITSNASPGSFDLSDSDSVVGQFNIAAGDLGKQFGFNIIFQTSANAQAVPEPASLALLGLGVLGLGALRLRRKAA